MPLTGAARDARARVRPPLHDSTTQVRSKCYGCDGARDGTAHGGRGGRQQRGGGGGGDRRLNLAVGEEVEVVEVEEKVEVWGWRWHHDMK